MNLAGFEVGNSKPFFLIARSCVIESEPFVLDVAAKLKEITAELRIPLVFKSSFDKANRSSLGSFRGPGVEAGLKALEAVKAEARRAGLDGCPRGHIP